MSNPENVDDQNLNDSAKAMVEGISAETNIETVSGGEVQTVNTQELQPVERNSVKLYFTPKNRNFVGLSYLIRHMIEEKTSRRFHSTSQQVIDTFKNWQAKLHRQLTSSQDHVKIFSITGYVLPRVSLYSGTGEFNGGPEGNWDNIIIGDFKMFSCATVNNWIVLTSDIFMEQTERFSVNLMKIAQSMGFNILPPKIISINIENTDSCLQLLDVIYNDINPSLIIIIMPEKCCKDTYISIKNKLCVDLGVPSQMVSRKLLNKTSRSVCAKLLVQINCKLGGIPWNIDIPVKGMMIVAFNTYSTNDKSDLVFGGLIATLDDTHSSFYNYVETFITKKHVSNTIHAVFLKALVKYKEKNGILPTSIVIYRADIEDGLVSYICNIEYKNIMKTYMDFYDGVEPPTAYILVQKRNSSQFFTCTENGVINNAFSGTVVDVNSEINPTKYDFLMTSRHGQYNIETPTYYVVLQDTLNDWSREKMINLTYKLTHAYYNKACARSIPSVCEMARKLAWFSNNILSNDRNPKLEESLFFL